MIDPNVCVFSKNMLVDMAQATKDRNYVSVDKFVRQNCPFPVVLRGSTVPPDILVYALSFLNGRDITRFLTTGRPENQLQRAMNYHLLQRVFFSEIKIFGRAEYKFYWGVNITHEFDPKNIDIRVLRAFLKIYYSPNPVEPDKLVKDSCLIPAIVPERVECEGAVYEFNPELVGQLAQYPGGGGYHAQYENDNDGCIEQRGKDKPECASLVILLREVIGRNKCWSKESENPEEWGQVQELQDLNTRKKYGCETEPGALPLLTVLFAQQAMYNQYPFGYHKLNRDGSESPSTWARTRELIHNNNAFAKKNYPRMWKWHSAAHGKPGRMALGCFSKRRDELGNPWGELRVANKEEHCSKLIGVGVLRVFVSERDSKKRKKTP